MSKVLCVCNRTGIDHRQREAEPNCQQRDDDRKDCDADSLDAPQRNADHSDLQHERDFDADDKQQYEHAGGDGDAVLHALHAPVVAREEGVRVVEAAGVVEALQDGADRVEGETEAVEDKDGGPPLLALRQQQQHDEQDERGTDLGGEVDADADGVGDVQVYVFESDGNGCSVFEEDGDWLIVGILWWSDCCHVF